ncbi:hypothetical protein L917_14045 [Phytophthora nicotianae]|uniref:PiggyBac transposable element-derived protein 4 C-terminal zinc-ribbon domain-containing protein n=2 Tax=Phytophthora nicotianae TaxID=4792 RepID=W2KMW7_PHYNI|nr:hypothetical protein L917_14045 [Phytophthora nicotianae]
MGLVDVAIVNAYILFREAQKRIDVRPTSHAEFLLELHAQLLAMKREVFVERSTASDVNSDAEDIAPFTRDHEPVECPDWLVVNGVRKRRQRQCKVCSILKRKIGERRATKYFCASCSKFSILGQYSTYVLYCGNSSWYIRRLVHFVD